MTQVAEKATRTLIGVVTSDARHMTRTVEVERAVRHPIYGKVQRKRTKLHAHDEKNQSKVGDKVRIREVRPISKTKHFELLEIIEKAK